MKSSQIFFLTPRKTELGFPNVLVSRTNNGSIRIGFKECGKLLKNENDRVRIGICENRLYFKFVPYSDNRSYKLTRPKSKTIGTFQVLLKEKKLDKFIKDEVYQIIYDSECDMYFIEDK